MSQDDAQLTKRRPPPEDDSLAANVKTIVGAIALALFIRIVFFEAFAIDGPSMEPSLLNGDRVVVAKYPYGLFLPFSREAIVTWGSPDVGDVVIVKSPADEEDIVKRVIGVAGDTVAMIDGQVYRNGEAVPTTLVAPCEPDSQKVVDPECRVYEETVGDRSWHTSHADLGFVSRDLANWAPVTVPDGHIVVLGDHRDQSNDSRRIGLIPLSRVKGHALFIYWSNDPGREHRWGRMFQGDPLSASADVEAIRARLRDELGTLVVDAPESVAFVYPSPYHTGMSSLGFQTLYRSVNQRAGRAAHRAFLPDDVAEARQSRAPLLTYEALRPVSSYSVLALSVAYELELAGVVECLELSGLPPLAEERDQRHPIVLAGGPLTFSNPLPLAPFVDVILMGEADETIHHALDIIFSAGDRDTVLRELADRIPSAFVPSLHGDAMPPVEKANDACLPAYSQILTPHTELREMFLVEPERGCHRGCEYCVMRRSTNDGMRTFDIDKVLSLVPEQARRVGLVGAATTDHPRIADLVEALADSGREVGLSSLRADRLNDRLCTALRRAGQTVLTTASDGASQRMRERIQRRAPESVLVSAAEFARAHGFKRLKLYMMLGLPGEEDEDVEELIEFSVRLSKIAPLSLGIAPFVAKRNTPLDGAGFAGIKLVDRRLDRLRKGVRGKVDVRGTSARWAWVEYVLAQGGQAEGRAVLDAVHNGGAFRAWKDAFDALPPERPTRALVRPGNRLGRALQVLG